MAKYLKLSKQAASFYCPVTKLSLVPGQVVKIPEGVQGIQSKVLQDAIQGGHVVEASEKEYNEQEKSLKKVAVVRPKKDDSSKKTSKKEEVFEEDDEDEEETDEDDEDTEDDEDEEEEVTRTEMIQSLRSSELPEDAKKKLTQTKTEELKVLYDTYVKN